jgi:hypothetical protein
VCTRTPDTYIHSCMHASIHTVWKQGLCEQTQAFMFFIWGTEADMVTRVRVKGEAQAQTVTNQSTKRASVLARTHARTRTQTTRTTRRNNTHARTHTHTHSHARTLARTLVRTHGAAKRDLQKVPRADTHVHTHARARTHTHTCSCARMKWPKGIFKRCMRTKHAHMRTRMHGA